VLDHMRRSQKRGGFQINSYWLGGQNRLSYDFSAPWGGDGSEKGNVPLIGGPLGEFSYPYIKKGAEPGALEGGDDATGRTLR